jgi:hypothetical protein
MYGIQEFRKNAMDDFDDFKNDAEWLRATAQFLQKDEAPDDKDRLKRFDVWLNKHHQETIDRAKKLKGGTAATIIRAGLDLLRMVMEKDDRDRLSTSDDDIAPHCTFCGKNSTPLMKGDTGALICVTCVGKLVSRLSGSIGYLPHLSR